MKVTVIQPDIVWGDPRQNISRVEEKIAKAPRADLYVLPEMWSTGFTMTPELHAESEPSLSLEWMKDAASRTGAAIAGSLAFKDGDFRNRFFFVKPGGEVFHYDKKHLFTYSGEHLRYTSGSRRVIIPWRGVRILLTVCYDIRFPMWCRNRDEYDLMLCVASWPSPRAEAWKSLVRARAVENQCYVAAVNRVGTDPGCKYQGDSAVIDCNGTAIAAVAPGERGTATVEIDMASLETSRAKFPLLKDVILYHDWNENF